MTCSVQKQQIQIVEKRKTVMEDLDKVEPAVQEAQLGESLVSNLFLRLFLSFDSGEIDQETESRGDQEPEQSSSRSETNAGIDLSAAR